MWKKTGNACMRPLSSLFCQVAVQFTLVALQRGKTTHVFRLGDILWVKIVSSDSRGTCTTLSSETAKSHQSSSVHVVEGLHNDTKAYAFPPWIPTQRMSSPRWTLLSMRHDTTSPVRALPPLALISFKSIMFSQATPGNKSLSKCTILPLDLQLSIHGQILLELPEGVTCNFLYSRCVTIPQVLSVATVSCY